MKMWIFSSVNPGVVYIYVSGLAPVRPTSELAGCEGGDVTNPNSALFRIEVIRVPLAHPVPFVQIAPVCITPETALCVMVGTLAKAFCVCAISTFQFAVVSMLLAAGVPHHMMFTLPASPPSIHALSDDFASGPLLTRTGVLHVAP